MFRYLWFHCILLLLLLYSGCSSEPSYLYPSRETQEIKYLCTRAYNREYSTNMNWKKSPPVSITVQSEKVTLYFENNEAFSMPRPGDVQLSSGSFRCP
ncbi:MAG: hypothetical protein HQM12_04350 [SAR324 cluster bacterium]|nr:hypothetical protein [SAR324 cluster bacterium]